MEVAYKGYDGSNPKPPLIDLYMKETENIGNIEGYLIAGIIIIHLVAILYIFLK